MARGSRIASRVGLVLALVQTLAAGLAAQVAPRVLTLDLDSARVTGGRIPFDQPFELRGKAPNELVQVTLIIRPDSQLPLDRCRSPASSANADRTPGSTTNNPAPWDSATWTRDDGRVLFSLRVGPIEAEKSYTLCVRTLTRLTDSATASIQGAVAARVADSIRSFYSRKGELPTWEPMVRELEAALIAALSRIDSAYYRDISGVYVPYDTAQLRARFTRERTNRDWNALFADLQQRHLDTSPARLIGARTQLYELLRLLRTRIRALRLDTIARAKPGTAHAQHNSVAAAIAASLPSYNDNDLNLIAWGATPFAAPDMNAPEPAIDTPVTKLPKSGAGLAAMRARLDTMAVQLRYLIDLASLAVRANPISQDTSALNCDSQAVRLVRANPISQGESDAMRTLYCARVVLYQVRTYAGQLAEALDATNDAAARLVPAFSTFSIAQIGVPGSSATTYVERSKDYISADVGILGAVRFPKAFAGGALQAYFGANFYLVPVNRDARYGFFCRHHSILKCVSLTVGLTTGSIARSNARTDLWGSHSLFTGFGLRFGSFFRFTVGSLIFHSYSNDSRHVQRITGTLAFALSADWDIRSTFGGLGDLLGGK